MASEVYDKVDVATADYDYTLSINAQGNVTEDIDDNQVVNRGMDNSREVVTVAPPIYYVSWDWAQLSSTDSGTIYDLYFDDDKAKRKARSFKWSGHDGHTYVVAFASTLTRKGNSVNRWGLPGIKLEILGKILDA